MTADTPTPRGTPATASPKATTEASDAQESSDSIDWTPAAPASPNAAVLPADTRAGFAPTPAPHGGAMIEASPSNGSHAPVRRMVRTNLPIGAGRLEFATLGPFELDSGAVLAELTVGYRHDGPGPDGAPQIVVVHALTGSADAASDWWAPLIGPGRALDTDRFGVVCANLLGSCYGTTGPTSRNPATGLPYGSSFPDVSTRDQARAQWRLFDALGIDRIELVAGGSLGGMVALEIGALRPGAVRTLVPIAAPARTGPMAIAWNHIQLRLIELLGDEGLSLARQLAMTTYRSEVDFDERFGRQRQPDGTLSIVSYLTYQGRKLLDRFDRDTYRVLAGAMTLHDLGYERGGIGAALTPLGAANGRLVGVGIQDDILYGPGQVRALVADAVAAGLRADYREIHSTKGHDAFLVEWPQLDELLRDALDGEARDPVRRPVPAGRRSVPSGAGRGGDVGK